MEEKKDITDIISNNSKIKKLTKEYNGDGYFLWHVMAKYIFTYEEQPFYYSKKNIEAFMDHFIGKRFNKYWEIVNYMVDINLFNKTEFENHPCLSMNKEDELYFILGNFFGYDRN